MNYIETKQTYYRKLHQSGQQQVQTLSEYFHTSPLTIRRDLIELEKQGIIERTYGGACLKKTPEPLHDFADKQAIHNREKELIAEYALSYIHDRDTIFMNSGTTIYQLLKLLDWLMNAARTLVEN